MDESNESDILHVLHEHVAHLWGNDKLKMIIKQRRHHSDHSCNEATETGAWGVLLFLALTLRKEMMGE